MKNTTKVLGITLLALVGLTLAPTESYESVQSNEPTTTQVAYHDSEYPDMTSPTQYKGKEIKDMDFTEAQDLMIDGSIPEVGTLDENGKEITLGMEF